MTNLASNSVLVSKTYDGIARQRETPVKPATVSKRAYLEVQPQHVIVDFVRELVEPSKGVDLVVAAIGHGGIDKAGGLLSRRP